MTAGTGMGEVIDFSDWRDRRRKNFAGDVSMNREDTARQCRAVFAKRADERPKMDEATRTRVAQNLYEIVQEAKAKDVKLSKVIPEALNLKDERLKEAPTKRLWWYTRAPVAKLRTKTQGYVRIAQEIAKALAPEIGSDENYFLPRLFRGTWYAGEPSETERRNAAIHVTRLQDDLHDMVAGIAIQHRLTDYFERLWQEQAPAYRLDPEKYWIDFGKGTSQPYSIFLAPDYGHIYAGEIGGLPSVKLYQKPFASEIPVKVFTSRNPIAISSELFPSAPDRVAWNRPIKGTATLWRDVRLSICPVPAWEAPQPVFEVRQVVMIDTSSDKFDLRDIVVSVEADGDFPVLRGKSLFLGRIEDTRSEPDYENRFGLLMSDLPNNLESSYQENLIATHDIWFFRLNRNSCRRYLEPEVEAGTYLAEHLRTVQAKGTRFPQYQIGAYVEGCLFDEPGRDLHSLMVVDVERRLKDLDDYCQERDAERETRRADARRRWQGKST